jgi:hypothetical protein
MALYAIALRHNESAIVRSRNAHSSNQRRLVVNPGSVLFFRNVLEHSFLQAKLSD